MSADPAIQALLDADEIVSDWKTIEQHETDTFARRPMSWRWVSVR
tara:strand:- start:2031 stop:2165 length:135 start_codon:yes stop_codon:yes gene_type:complete